VYHIVVMRVKRRICAPAHRPMCTLAHNGPTDYLDESFRAWYSGFTRSGKDHTMKLAIAKSTCIAAIVTDEEAATLTETHRIVDATETSRGHGVVHYTDVWGGTWAVTDKTECTVGAMEKWA
jgi:hypothetical protein